MTFQFELCSLELFLDINVRSVCVAGKKLAGGWTPTGKQPNPLQPPDKKVRGVGLGQEVCTLPRNQCQSGSRVTVVPGRVGSRVSVTDPVPSLTGWSEWTVDGATSVCSACRCSADLLQTEVYEHITPLLMELHWLSVPERI